MTITRESQAQDAARSVVQSMAAGMCTELSGDLESVIEPQYRDRDIKVYLETSLVDWLDQRAREIGMSRSQIVRRMILLGKKAEETPPASVVPTTE